MVSIKAALESSNVDQFVHQNHLNQKMKDDMEASYARMNSMWIVNRLNDEYEQRLNMIHIEVEIIVVLVWDFYKKSMNTFEMMKDQDIYKETNNDRLNKHSHSNQHHNNSECLILLMMMMMNWIVMY